MTEEIRTIKMQLPGGVRSFVCKVNDFYTIVINDDLSREAALKAYRHELSHIMNEDFSSDLLADELEEIAHSA